jgi:hypothetical protein
MMPDVGPDVPGGPKVEIEGISDAPVPVPPPVPIPIPSATANATGTTGTSEDKKEDDDDDQIDWCWQFWCFIPGARYHKYRYEHYPRSCCPSRWHLAAFILRIALYITVLCISSYIYHHVRTGGFEIPASFPPSEPTAIMSPGCSNSTADALILDFGCAPSDGSNTNMYHYGCTITGTPDAILYAERYGVAAYIFFIAMAVGTVFCPYFLFFFPLLFSVGLLRAGYQNMVVGHNPFSWCVLRSGYVDFWGDLHYTNFPYTYHKLITQPACQITFTTLNQRNNLLDIMGRYQCTGTWYDDYSKKAFVNIMPTPHVLEEYGNFQQHLEFLFNIALYLICFSFVIIDVVTVKLLFTKPFKKICHCRGFNNRCHLYG